MKISKDNADAEFNYLSINGLAMTADTSVFPSSAITGPITATTFTDRISSRNAKELAVNFTVTQASGNLAINFLVLDPMEPSNGTTGFPPTVPPPLINLPLLGVPITGTPANIRMEIVSGQATLWANNKQSVLGPLNVPMLWQIQLVVSGVGASFSVIGTFEARQ